GSRTSEPELNEVLLQIAILTGTTVVHLKNVPSQPIVFSDEVVLPGTQDNSTSVPLVLRQRSEDEIIAYSYDKFLKSFTDNNGSPTFYWPLLFPMVKSVVKTMDMVEAVLPEVDGFIVAGASKRGWTTWLTGAVDPRVKAIAPIVINVLNMPENLAHHKKVYGYWSPAIYDYAQEQIFDRLLPSSDDTEITPEAKALLSYVDPYEYALKGAYEEMPKFLLNATGDEFFVPDTAELYLDELGPDTHMSYVPNVGHGMGEIGSGTALTDSSNPIGMFVAWYMAVTQDKARPKLTYELRDDGRICTDVDPSNLPVHACLWQATSTGKRDFRDNVIGDAWEKTTLQLRSGSYYITPTIPAPAQGDYNAYFIQLEYLNPAQFPPMLQSILEDQGLSVPNMIFSTDVRVWPPEYPDFTGYVANDERPDAVPFEEEKLPVIVVYGTPYEMGNYYGQLLFEQINAFVPEYIAFYCAQTGCSDAWLDEAWNSLLGDDEYLPLIDTRIQEEVAGIAGAAGVEVSLEMLQRAHAAMMFEELGSWTTASTVAYRDLLTEENNAHAVTINSRFREHQCAVVYIPNDGAPHTVLTYAGLAFGRTGINLGGISAVEVVEISHPGFTGLEPNALSLIRTILYDAFSLGDAVELTKHAYLQRPTTIMLSDGRNEKRGAMISMYPDNQLVAERYDLAFSEFGIEDQCGVLYGAEEKLQLPLKAVIAEIGQFGEPSPSLSLEDMALLANQPPFVDTEGNPLNVVFDVDGLLLNIAVSVAQYSNEAYLDTPDIFNMQNLLP
ncbi:MAG: hypothetical protein KAH38_04110, partial [Candidatus Hydrogenedentes bacterium]|nr:hypothetical protein [Candidatus Hydrogenedentota bacterium]